MNYANYGDTRILIVFPCDRPGYEQTEVREAPEGVHCSDALLAISPTLPTWGTVYYQRCITSGPLPLWKNVTSIQRIPKPGWAVPGAVHCRQCGDVAQSANALTCGHSNPSNPYPSFT